MFTAKVELFFNTNMHIHIQTFWLHTCLHCCRMHMPMWMEGSFWILTPPLSLCWEHLRWCMEALEHMQWVYWSRWMSCEVGNMGVVCIVVMCGYSHFSSLRTCIVMEVHVDCLGCCQTALCRYLPHSLFLLSHLTGDCKWDRSLLERKEHAGH